MISGLKHSPPESGKGVGATDGHSLTSGRLRFWGRFSKSYSQILQTRQKIKESEKGRYVCLLILRAEKAIVVVKLCSYTSSTLRKDEGNCKLDLRPPNNWLPYWQYRSCTGLREEPFPSAHLGTQPLDSY